VLCALPLKVGADPQSCPACLEYSLALVTFHVCPWECRVLNIFTRLQLQWILSLQSLLCCYVIGHIMRNDAGLLRSHSLCLNAEVPVLYLSQLGCIECMSADYCY